MNSRIEELIEQCYEYSDMSHSMFFNKERFAELIIRECVDIIEEDLSVNKVKAENDIEGKAWVNAQLTFSELIKSRFGVK